MTGLSLLSQISLYVLLVLMGLYAPLLWGWQIMILKGKSFKNPDGSTTATSLRFYNPRQSLISRLIGYPFGILVGLAYIVWTVLHFDVIYLP